jgi:hypothetical protein
MDLTDNPKTKFESDYKVTILSTLHGNSVFQNGVIETFLMPPRVTMKYISMSSPLGVCVLHPPKEKHRILSHDRYQEESIDTICEHIAHYGTGDTSELFLKIGDIAKKLAAVNNEKDYNEGIQKLANSLQIYTIQSVIPSSIQRTGLYFENKMGIPSDEMDQSDMLTTAQVNFDSRQHHANISKTEANKLDRDLQLQRDVDDIGRIITVSTGESFPNYVYGCFVENYNDYVLEYLENPLINKIIDMNTGEDITVPFLEPKMPTMKSIKLSDIVYKLWRDNKGRDIQLLFVSFSCEQPQNISGVPTKQTIRLAKRNYKGKIGGTRKKRKKMTKKRKRTRRKITKR